jgi:signal peptide peptidase SppA
MKLLDVLTSPWAIEPTKLREIQAIYATHLRGDKIDIAAVEQRLGRPLDNQPKGYSILDGVAVLPIEGVIAKRANLFMQISGGTSSELLARDLRQAIADPAVHAIVLQIDSPGGTVDGTQALADLIAASAESKPIATLGGGSMASAAYWIGSAAGAGRVYIADATTAVGSIGVVATHVDVSGAEAQRGLRTTEITAGKYKRVASQYGPLTEEGRATMQEQVDYTYSLFVEAVAQQRGVTPEAVLERMAEGRIFQGAQAVAAGLADGIATLDDLVAELNSRRRAAVATKGPSMAITREQLAAEAPDLLVALQAEGAAAERQRIAAVQAQCLPGHEALIARLAADGQTTGPEAAIAVLTAERSVRAAAGQALHADAPQPVPASVTPAYQPPAGADAQEDPNLPVEQRCEAAWKRDSKLHAEFGSLAAYTAYVRASERGVARIMNKQGA